MPKGSIAYAVVALMVAAVPTLALNASVALQSDGQSIVRTTAGSTIQVDVVLTADAPMVSAQLMIAGPGNYFSAESAGWADGWRGIVDLNPRPQNLPTSDVGAHAANLDAGISAGYLARLVIRVDANTPPGTYELIPQDLVVGDLNFESGTVSEIKPLTVIIGGGAAGPTLVSAVSQRTHGQAGAFAIPLSDSAVESRSGGPLLVLATFDGAVQAAGPSSVTASSGTVMGVSANASTVAVAMSGVPDGDTVTLAFPGVTGTGGGASTSTLCFNVLTGDVNSDLTVNLLDVLAVRNSLNQAVNDANFRRDVNADGMINLLDVLAVRNNLHRTAAGCD